MTCLRVSIRGTDVADPLELLLKVILLPLAGWVFEPLVVHGETLHQILVQATDGPLPKLRAPVAAHAKTDLQNGVEVVVLDLPGYSAGVWKL